MMADLLVALAFVALGVLCSAVYIVALGFAKSKVAVVVLDVVSALLLVATVWATNLFVNNGQFRLFVVVAFAIGVQLNVTISKRTLDKLSKALYNLFTNKGVDKNGKDFL